jgi:hypothetical protein
MKKTLTSLALATFAFAASAGPFTIVPGTPAGSAFNISQFDAVNSVYNTKASFLAFLAGEGFSLANAQRGTLFFNNGGATEGSVIAEYLGKEAGYTNLFTLTNGTGGSLSTATSTFTVDSNGFGFGSIISAGAPVGNVAVEGLFSSVQSGNHPASTLFVLNSDGTRALGLFNDRGSNDKDFDDMVVRFSGTAGIGDQVTQIPEPGTWALLLAGLGALGLVTRRRKA